MAKKNLILLHGALGSSKSFDALVPQLSDDFNLFIPDFNGHGSRSKSDFSFNMQDLVKDLEDFLVKKGIDSCSVFGYSMGGYVALSLALKKPEYFGGIMTLGTKLDWKTQQAEKESKMLNPEKIQEKVPQFSQHLKALHGESWMNLCDQTAEMMLDLGKNPILSTDNISTIDLPIRLGLGDQDNMVSLDETIAFYRALVQGELQVFPNFPHPIEKVDPQIIANSIKQFF
ncbi:alpha/beta fold hydrolase [Marivirga salinae]|uniref:Alpha/beta fold hydrolase n=1 Tax=Marivirga salinarum TaxID=3059078 RepID=A0AA51NAP2_9BACT|nr:alpha/beta fold hydrolase [Marivirga sp. BDSF4-3]WMN11663.1 alpha/beta fold hydrolase [Marivirga sp. BDSF4-3]